MGSENDEVRDLHLQLHSAIEFRSNENIKVIIDQLCQHQSSSPGRCEFLNFYSHTDQLQSPFLHAVAKGNPEAALHLLQKGFNPFNKVHPTSEKCPDKPVLNKCIFRLLEKPGFESVVMTLLDMSDDVITGSNSDTVLHAICKKKLTRLLRLILCSTLHNQMLFMPNKQGCLPIHIAAKYNFVEFFKLVFHSKSSRLLPSYRCECQSSKKCQHKLEPNDYIPLSEHIMKPLSKTMNVNMRVKGKKLTSLHMAAKERHVEVAEFLLDHGADVHASSEGSRTALIESLDIGADVAPNETKLDDIYQMCKLLIKAGASVNVFGTILYSQRRSMANDDTLTPLHLAAGLGSLPTINLLLNNGSDASALSKDMGRIALHFAIEKGHNECVEKLLTNSLYPEGFLVSYMDYAFNTLLHSVDKCNDEIFLKLMDLGCPLDRPNVNNLRPLDKAITSKNISFIHMLLKRQPHIVNVHLYQDPKATLPLYLAAISKLPLCQILLSYGADIYARAYGKHMAFRKAFRYNRYENAVYLCEQMSRPFTLSEKEELLSHEAAMDEELSLRLRRRLNNIPGLVSMCLDTVRQRVIKNKLSFKDLDTLPVPHSVIKALRYNESALSTLPQFEA